MSDTEGVVMGYVIVTKIMLDDDVVIDIDESPGLAVIDAVGMLAFAQHTLLDAPTRDDEDEPE